MSEIGWLEGAVWRDLDEGLYEKEVAHKAEIRARASWARRKIADATDEEILRMAQFLKRLRFYRGVGEH